MKESSFPIVSIILPVFNEEKSVKQTIENICDQSFQDFELVVINDGSTDKTQEIIELIKDVRIEGYTNTRNCGLTKTLNLGLDLAKGEFVVIANCGDVWSVHKLRKQVEEMRRDKDIVIVGTVGQYPKEKTARASSNVDVAMYFGNPFIHSGIMIRKNKDLFYNEDFLVSQDYELFQRLMGKGRMVVLGACLIKLREQKPHSFENTIKVLKRFYPNESDRMIEIINMKTKPTVKEYIELVLVFLTKAIELRSFEFVKLAVFRLIVILKGLLKNEKS